ncbi:O-antigen/teichoic acid export membrane protein [Arthrobacter sp. SLBN-100]|uniref:lipopolysaccharide biosynthesis protein n=1 Tax=Arthrobacter sp. SLBN-100 TaxID=2768450 RepID=UPI00114FECBD|nr:polysaccharide biosynthesis protein [Arthrobacter sp. SLBN-100]TQJ69569.1 O-antigen/teichoic acid export membrane protein [Arthrobacter sp. SLBN-100]
MSTVRGDPAVDASPVRHSALRSSLGLILAKGAQTGSGFAFWVVAAHAASDREVGLTTAAVSAVLICAQLAVLGAGSAVIVSVGRGEPPARVLDAAFGIVALASTVLALGYLVLQLTVAPDTASVSVLFWLMFLVAAVTGTLGTVLDQALVALGRGASATLRYTLGGGVSLGAAALVAWQAHPAAADLLMACWTLGTALTCIVGVVQLRRLVGYRPRPSLRLAGGRPLLMLGIPNQLLTLTERAPGLVLPLLLAHMVSPEAAAYWYPAWMMAWAAYTAPMLMGIVQFSEGVREPGRLVSVTWATLRWSLAIGGLGAAVLIVFARPLLHLLGDQYAEASAGALQWLAAGVVAYAVLQAYNAVCRARGRYAEAIVVGVVLAVALCVSALSAAEQGASAMALNWLVVLSIGALAVGLRLVAILRRVKQEVL